MRYFFGICKFTSRTYELVAWLLSGGVNDTVQFASPRVSREESGVNICD